ncbi:uncharacterized conserved protein [Sanguibacter keddieii DSM 10542]|uniref:Uncharacterized conserved protein n=1 Tax=Sanguibacter keddieii (strain ATCC 51767 / DSM 10542 / NCFB 3025 / ST-74) TaxID=446469 RepID=D1BFK8_SANKS|nr:HdeD family acid-resistance protein [Sanguibacter keddieii]ACZ23511.1 uncharacterized conserved protein [Sanguibacter keddieii DSM 10542]
MARTTGKKQAAVSGPSDGAHGPQGIELRKARGLWMMPLVRGLLLILLGLLLMVQPLGTLDRLIMLFAVFLVLDGVVAAVQGLVNRDQIGWRWWLVQGAVDVVFAVIILVWPGATALVLFYLLVVWTLVLGVAAIAGSVALVRNRDLGWPWLLTIGLLSTLFGFLLVTRSQDGAAALELVTVVFGIYAFVSGAVHVVSVFAIRSVAQEIDRALTGQSLVVDAMAARQVAAREAAEERAQARATATAEKKAEKKAAKEAGRGDGDAPRAARDTKVIHLPDESHDSHPAGGSSTRDEGAARDRAHVDEERVYDDELAATGFPDSPGVVSAPPAVVPDEERSGRVPARTDRAQPVSSTTPSPASPTSPSSTPSTDSSKVPASAPYDVEADAATAAEADAAAGPHETSASQSPPEGGPAPRT